MLIALINQALTNCRSSKSISDSSHKVTSSSSSSFYVFSKFLTLINYIFCNTGCSSSMECAYPCDKKQCLHVRGFSLDSWDHITLCLTVITLALWRETLNVRTIFFVHLLNIYVHKLVFMIMFTLTFMISK